MADVEALVDAAKEAILQLEYLDERFPTGTTPATIARLKIALGDVEASPPRLELNGRAYLRVDREAGPGEEVTAIVVGTRRYVPEGQP